MGRKKEIPWCALYERECLDLRKKEIPWCALYERECLDLHRLGKDSTSSQQVENYELLEELQKIHKELGDVKDRINILYKHLALGINLDNT